MSDIQAVRAEYKECFKCGYQAETAAAVCPRCGRRLQTEENIRNRGILLIVVGLFLSVFMGIIALLVGTMLMGSMKDADAARRIHDKSAFLLVVYGLFAMLIAFGINSVITGIWQVVFGRRNKVLIWVMWALLFSLFLVGGIIEGFGN